LPAAAAEELAGLRAERLKLTADLRERDAEIIRRETIPVLCPAQMWQG
jgi:hypothetical protein